MIRVSHNTNKFIIKILFLSLILVGPLTLNSSNAEINSKYWTVNCADNEKKKGCLMGATSEYENKETKKKVELGKIFIEVVSTKEKIMKLVNEDEQTYKIGEENKNVPILFIYLPLNTDLRKKPLVIIDGKKVINIAYLACNSEIGCKALGVLDTKQINLFKEGKNLSVIFPVLGREENLKIIFSLKGFAKGYSKLIS
tara:strand:- start:2228 stop:2821 length:594 start_codon:yes stop_codon:yes gene_type:complete